MLSGPVGRLGRLGAGTTWICPGLQRSTGQSVFWQHRSTGCCKVSNEKPYISTETNLGTSFAIRSAHIHTHNRCHWNWVSTLRACWVYPQVRLIRLRKRLSFWLNELTTWCGSDGAVCLLLLEDSETACPAYVSRRVYVLGPPNPRVFPSLIYHKTWHVILFSNANVILIDFHTLRVKVWKSLSSIDRSLVSLRG